MSKGFRRRVAATILIVGGAVYVAATDEPLLGLDLRGGTQIVLEAHDTPQVEVDADVMNRTLEVMRRRVDAVGVTEPTLQVSGDRRIIIELPGISNPDEAISLIGRTAQLTFHPVLEVTDSAPSPTGDDLVLEDDQGFFLRLGPAVVLGEQVAGAAPFFDTQAADWVVQIDFRADGAEEWARLTGEAACAPPTSPMRRIAIVLDSEVISSPGVALDVACGVGITGGLTVITGSFDEESAGELALLIRAGALPVPVEVIERGTIGPTLGETAIAVSIDAALIGASLTILYMIAYYRLLGVMAAVSLLVYGLVSYAVLLALGATLTLPGIAGFVLAIGMAVDANVLVYERTKEEYAAGSATPVAAIAGFRRAWSAIADANVTTVLAAVLLFFFASGAVRGFGVTLTVGVVVSMFSALVVTRVLVETLTALNAVGDRPRLLGLNVGSWFRDWLAEHRPDLIGRSRLWLSISGVAIVVAIVGMVGPGFNFGVEFQGGRLLEYRTSTAVDLGELRSHLAEAGFPRAVAQLSGQGNLVIRSKELTAEEELTVENAVQAVAGDIETVRDQFVGPTLGDELRNKAFIALGVALGAQLLYLAIRFRWTMAVSAVVGMFHDVAILIGVFAWLGKTIDGVFLASLLTVIGYSINDSVVVFDRIREQRQQREEEPLAAVANDACLQTIPRTINTGLGAVFILGALYVLGGDTLTDFALALLIGIVVGTYSSVFTAAPLAVRLGERFPPRPSEKTPTREAGVPRGKPPSGRIFD